MLREMLDVRQVTNDYFRRWFADTDFDLYIWYNPNKSFHGFQLCYDLATHAKALTWIEDHDFSHHGVDAGEESPLANRAPVLVPDGHFHRDEVLRLFQSAARDLPDPIKDFVIGKIAEYE